MQAFKTVILLLTAIAVSSRNCVFAQDLPRRNLRAQHNGEDQSTQAASAPSAASTPSAVAIPFANDAARLASDAANNAAQRANGAGNFADNDWIPNTGVDLGAGASTTNINFAPFTFSRSVDIGPGSVKANLGVGLSLGTPSSTAASNAADTGSTPSTNVGASGSSLNPLTMAATLAHHAHGAVLGHTGTLPSSFMQNQAATHH